MKARALRFCLPLCDYRLIQPHLFISLVCFLVLGVGLWKIYRTHFRLIYSIKNTLGFSMAIGKLVLFFTSGLLSIKHVFSAKPVHCTVGHRLWFPPFNKYLLSTCCVPGLCKILELKEHRQGLCPNGVKSRGRNSLVIGPVKYRVVKGHSGRVLGLDLGPVGKEGLVWGNVRWSLKEK